MITYQELKQIVENKLVTKTEDRTYEELSELIFGEGNCFSESEVRKRMYGMKRVIDVLEQDDDAVATRVLSVSDAHVPYNLPVSIFRNYSGMVDILVFNGDTEDCYSASSFPKKYREPLGYEMAATRTYMIDVIEMIKPKKVLIVKGNHEHRLGKYLNDQVNEDVFDIMPDTPLELIVSHGFRVKNRKDKTETYYSPLADYFKEVGIQVEYTGDWWVKVGNVIFAHPLSYSSGMLKTTEKAVNYFLRIDRDFSGIVMAHTHKVGSFVQGGIKMYEQGCCCDLDKLDYNDGKLTLPTQNGFIYVCLDKDGNIIDSKTKLINL